MSDEQPGSDKRRIEALEVVVRSLVSEVERLRGDVASLTGAPVARSAAVEQPVKPKAKDVPLVSIAETPAEKPFAFEPVAHLPTKAAASTPAASGDLEQLVGRYGTLVVATLALLLGLGAFLQWAIARGLLGPEVRVGLGAVASVVLAVLGLRVRARGSVTYGNALLVIALAIVHLVAWAAGPELGLVPPMFALVVAAAASAALAALALREGEEFLFCLGLGGALFAPFVTMIGDGTPAQLLLYGGVVLAGAIVALRDAGWRVAQLLLPMFAAWYMVSGGAARTSDMSPASAFWPAAFALALSLVALTLGARGVRRDLVRGMLFLVAIAILGGGNAADTPPWTAVAYGLFGALTAHALRRRTAATGDGAPDTAYEVVGLPLIFLFCAVVVEELYETPEGAAVAAAWAALTLVFLFLDGVPQRARHLAVILTAAFAASMGVFPENDVARIAAFATVAVMAIFTLDRIRGASLLLPIGLSLGTGAMQALVLYERRVAWEYTPFLNAPSLAAATLVAAFVMLSWLAPRALTSEGERRGPWNGDLTIAALRTAGTLAAFLWMRAEFAEAFSSDIATFLLISYYALFGVGLILVGRARAVSFLRQTGLVLSLFAAFKAVMEASDVDRVGLRIGSYLVVGVFLLGVGYLYRAGVPEVASDA